MGYSAGTVWLEVTPSFDGLQNATKIALAKAFSQVGGVADKEFGKIPKVAEEAAEKAGKDFNNAFGRQLKKTITGLRSSLGDSLSDILPEADVERFKDTLNDISKMNFNLPSDMDKAHRTLRGMRTEIAGLAEEYDTGSRKFSAATRANLGAAVGEIDNLSRNYKKLGRTMSEVATANSVAERQHMKMLEQAHGMNEKFNRDKIKMDSQAHRMNEKFDLDRLKAIEAQEAAVRRMANTQMQAQRMNRQHDRAPLDQMIKDLQRATQEFDKIKIDVDLDDADFLAKAAILAEAAEKVMEEAMRVDVDLDSDDLLRKTTMAAKAASAAAPAVVVDVRLERNKQKLAGDLAEFQAFAKAMKHDIKFDANFDTTKATAHLAAWQAALESMDGKNVTAEAKFKIAAALREVAVLQVALRAAEAQSRKTSSAFSAIGAGSAANAVRVFNGTLFALVSIGPVLIPMLAATAAGILGVGAAALAVLGGIGLLVAAFSGIPNALKASTAQEKASKEAGAKQTGRSAQQKVGDQRSLDDAKKNLARTRRDAAYTLEDSNKRVEKAQRSLMDAEEAAAESAQKNAEAVADAQKSLVAARQTAVKAAEDASRRVAAAERSLQNAQAQSVRAQRALNDARAQGVRDLEDMNNQLKSAQLSERGGQFAIEEAAARYAAILDDPQATAREKAKAELDYEQAQQSLKEQQLQTRRLEKDTAAANKAGVEGSRSVVDAKEAVKSAQQAVMDAELALRDARLASTEAAIDQSDRIAKAQKAVADALKRQSDDARKQVRSVGDAEQALADARRDNARQILQTSERIADAELSLARVIEDQKLAAAAALATNSALASAQDAYREAMDNLSPAGQRFVKFLEGLKPLLKELRFAAQESFLPPLQAGMELLVDTYGPSLVRFVGDIGTAMGEVATKSAEMFVSPWWKDFFGTMAEMAPRFLTVLGDIGLNLLTVFAGVLEAFAPFGLELLDAFSGITDGMAEWAKELSGSDGFASFMKYVRDAGPKVSQLLRLIGDVLVKFVVALAPHADKVLGVLIMFFEFLDGLSTETFGAVAVTILSVVTAVQLMAGVAAMIQGPAMLVAGLAGIIGGTAVAVVAAVVGIGIALYALYTHFEGFRNFVDAWYGFWIDVWKGVFAAVSTAVGAVVTVIQNVLIPVIMFLWNNVVSPVFTLIGGAFKIWWTIVSTIFGAFKAIIETVVAPVITWLWDKIFKPVFTLIGGIFEVTWAIIKTMFDAFVQIIKFVVAPILQWFWESIVGPIFGWIGEKIDKVWKNVIKPVFEAFAGFISEHVAPIFSAAVEKIGKIWSGLLDLMKAPIRMGIDLVINKGLIKAFNWLAGKIPGMTELAEVKIPSALQGGSSGSKAGAGNARFAFADGGVLPGYTPGRDVHTFLSPTGGRLDLSGGEAIMRPEWVEMIGGPEAVHRMNSIARQGFADGGIFGALGRYGGKAWRKVRNTADGLAAFVDDPVASIGGVIKNAAKNMGLGDGPLVQAVTGAALMPLDAIEKLVKREAAPAVSSEGTLISLGSFGQGSTSVAGVPGYQKMIQMVQGLIPGVRVTSSYRPGATTAGYGTTSFHALGRAIDLAGGPGLGKIWDVLNATYGMQSKELLYSPKGASQIVGGGRKNTSGITKDMHYNHVHWAMADGGILPTLYDTGGDVPPGLSVIANKTRKPEVVLTNQFVNEVRAKLNDDGGGMNFDMRGARFGYDPREVASEVDKKRKDRLALAGVRRVGGI